MLETDPRELDAVARDIAVRATPQQLLREGGALAKQLDEELVVERRHAERRAASAAPTRGLVI